MSHRPPPSKPISEVLAELCAQEDGHVTVGEVIDAFGRRAFGALLFVFSCPNVLPLPPGSSTVLGAPLVLIAPQVALGVGAPWLPKALDDRRLRAADLARAFSRLITWVQRIERVSRPRLPFMFGPVGDRMIGAVCTLLALILILPIPMGNLLPAITIGVLGFALAQRDGLIAMVGYGLAVASLGVLALTFGAAIAGFRMLLTWIGAA